MVGVGGKSGAKKGISAGGEEVRLVGGKILRVKKYKSKNDH
jgi:hypothetical protein